MCYQIHTAQWSLCATLRGSFDSVSSLLKTIFTSAIQAFIPVISACTPVVGLKGSILSYQRYKCVNASHDSCVSHLLAFMPAPHTCPCFSSLHVLICLFHNNVTLLFLTCIAYKENTGTHRHVRHTCINACA